MNFDKYWNSKRLGFMQRTKSPLLRGNKGKRPGKPKGLCSE